MDNKVLKFLLVIQLTCNVIYIEGYDDALIGKCFQSQGATVIKSICMGGDAKVTVQCSNGWLVWLRRLDGEESFARPWADYKDGFGNAYRELWLGLDLLHNITESGSFRLRVEMSDFDGVFYWAEYSTFAVASEEDLYQLTATRYDTESNAGDSLDNKQLSHYYDGNPIYHSGMKFSTYDRENDIHKSYDCSDKNGRGGWWYSGCHTANPTGIYNGTSASGAFKGLAWKSAKNECISFKTMALMLRPNN